MIITTKVSHPATVKEKIKPHHIMLQSEGLGYSLPPRPSISVQRDWEFKVGRWWALKEIKFVRLKAGKNPVTISCYQWREELFAWVVTVRAGWYTKI